MRVFDNTVKGKLRDGKKVVGAWAQIASPITAEILAEAGFDVVMIDLEHGPGDILTTNLLLTLASAALWAGFWFLNKYALSETLVTTGINLVYVPAGIRLLLVLVFGVWGALGVFLADPVLFLSEFGHGAPLEIIVNSAISGFGPYLAVKAAGRIAGIAPDLNGLSAWHLPVLALAVSLVLPLLFTLHFMLNDRYPPALFGRNYMAMATGDFLGCFLVLAFARGLIWAYRAVAAVPRT